LSSSRRSRSPRALASTPRLDNAEQVNFGAPGVSERLGGEVGLGMLGEFLGTFFLVWAIVGVAVNPSAVKDWAALAIGGALAYVLAPVLGAVAAGILFF
jgi:glycerol uptake facilitator-like aquaporin